MEDENKQTFIGNLKNCFSYVIGFVIIGFAANFFINKDKSEYMGMFYSTDEERSVYEFKKGFKTLDKCREWAKKQARDRKMEDEEWDYDCGIGCELSSEDFDPKVTMYDCGKLEK